MKMVYCKPISVLLMLLLVVNAANVRNKRGGSMYYGQGGGNSGSSGNFQSFSQSSGSEFMAFGESITRRESFSSSCSMSSQIQRRSEGYCVQAGSTRAGQISACQNHCMVQWGSVGTLIETTCTAGYGDCLCTLCNVYLQVDQPNFQTVDNREFQNRMRYEQELYNRQHAGNSQGTQIYSRNRVMVPVHRGSTGRRVRHGMRGSSGGSFGAMSSGSSRMSQSSSSSSASSSFNSMSSRSSSLDGSSFRSTSSGMSSLECSAAQQTRIYLGAYSNTCYQRCLARVSVGFYESRCDSADRCVCIQCRSLYMRIR